MEYKMFSNESAEGATFIKSLQTIIKGILSTKTAVHGTSLNEALGPTSITPFCVITRTCANLDNLNDINSFLLSAFTERYCQAVTLYGATIKGMRVIKLLDRFNPNRKVTEAFLSLESDVANHYHNLNNYKHKLPSLEDAKVNKVDDITQKEALASLGKQVAIELGAGKETFTIRVTTRLLVTIEDDDLITAIVSKNTHPTKFKDRLNLALRGHIRWIKDFIFWEDEIQKERRVMALDKKGTYRKIVKRATESKKAGAISQNISMNTHSNIYVIDENTAKNVELALGEPITSFSARERIFLGTYAMILAIVDRDWENITIYFKGEEGGSTLTWKELVKAKKNANILEVLNQKNMGGSLI